jgi:hypothetical protein
MVHCTFAARDQPVENNPELDCEAAQDRCIFSNSGLARRLIQGALDDSMRTNRRPSRLESTRKMTKHKSPLYGLATRVGLGGLARTLYHEPIGQLRSLLADGGPIERHRTERGRLDMISAAERLPRLLMPENQDQYEICFLSGEKYWYQTIFCAYSLHIQCDVKIIPHIFDDGSLSESLIEKITHIIPWTKFTLIDEINERIENFLPTSQFPTLRERRLEYAHIKKLTDIHLNNRLRTVVLDSDMLFFRKPHAFLSALKSGQNFYIPDIETAYGYDVELLNNMIGKIILPKVNVGLYGLNSGNIDWNEVEHWCKLTLENSGPNYLQEQALTAMLLTRADAIQLPKSEYIVCPGLQEGRAPRATLHHYVNNSKRSYFQTGWKQVLKQALKA